MPQDEPFAKVNPNVPHIARVYNYWLGGKDNFAADREVAEQIMATMPITRASTRANRAFLARAVHYAVTEAGVRQFLDIGTGLPSGNNTHEVAQRAAPESRIVYVDNDPVVLVHAQALLTSAPGGVTAYIEADARDVDKILHTAAETLDFTRPVAVMLVGILHCIPDEDDPYAIVTRLLDAVPSGSHLLLSHPGIDIVEEMRDVQERQNAMMPPEARVTFRSHEQVTRFFDGLELLEPGVVPTSQWRPGVDVLPAPMPLWAGVARKP